MFSILAILFAFGTAEAKPIDNFCDASTVNRSNLEHIDQEIVVFGVDTKKVTFGRVRMLGVSQVVSPVTGEVMAVGGEVYVRKDKDLDRVMESVSELTGLAPMSGESFVVWTDGSDVSLLGQGPGGEHFLVLDCDHLD